MLAMSFAILALSAESVVACTDAELANYECSVDAEGYFEVSIVKPFPEVGPCEIGTCSFYRYKIEKLQEIPDASNFNLIVERPFAERISSLNCDGLWNCYYNRSEPGSEFTLVVEGVADSAPSDWFIYAAFNDDIEHVATLDYNPYGIHGIIQAPALAVAGAVKPVIAKTSEDFSYVNEAGETYTVKVNKDQAGNIISIKLRGPGCEEGEECEQDITDKGIPIDQFEISYDGGESWESLKFITEQIVTKTDENSTCAYWYRGYYYNFCGY